MTRGGQEEAGGGQELWSCVRCMVSVRIMNHQLVAFSTDISTSTLTCPGQLASEFPSSLQLISALIQSLLAALCRSATCGRRAGHFGWELRAAVGSCLWRGKDI